MSRAAVQLPARGRGKILVARPLSASPRRLAVARPTTVTWRVWMLMLALPMFAQCFQYMIDVPPLYALSKAWPILMLPFTIWAIASLDVPYKPLYIATFFWIFGVTPVIGIVQLGNGFGAALATTTKVWAYTFMFSGAGLLVWLRLSAHTLRRVLTGLGIATFVIMALLWVVMPARAYGGGDVVTKLFMYDPERGRHIYMPMFFGLLGIFTLNRSFWAHPRLWKVVAIVVGFALMLVIYKERATIAGAALAVILGAAMCMGRWRWAAFAVLAVGGGVGVYLAAAHLQSTAAASGAGSLGGSLAVRSVSVATAWSYLSANPLRWLLGVGATTRFGDITLAQLFGNPMFFLTDIGWLGVMFEYGAIGAVLMLLAHLAGLRLAFQWSRGDDALSQACIDYIIYLIIVSAIYSVVFTPGELTTVMAICWFLHRQAKAQGGDTPHSAMPRPRQNAMARPRPSGYPALSGPSGIASNG